MKNTVLIAISLFVLVSIVRPVFLLLIDVHTTSEIVWESGEEDSSQKESKTEFEEKDTFFVSYTSLLINVKKLDNELGSIAIQSYRNLIIDIQSPPPERIG